LREVCSHVAALLFAVEASNKEEKPAPTSLACMWNKTSKKVDPVPVACRKRRCQKKIFKKSVLTPKEAYATFIAAIKKRQPDAPYLEELTDDKGTSYASDTENQENDEAIKSIESSTKEQAACAMWNHQRKGRVTSSLFGKVLSCKTHPKGLAQILGRNFSNAAIEWVKNPEVVAKAQFLCYLSEQHVNRMLLPCGLMIDAENIFLRAFPVGLLVCDCYEITVLEIKCPVTVEADNTKAVFLLTTRSLTGKPLSAKITSPGRIFSKNPLR
ncbi:hypothetical protein NPIL_277501, partial [Nephila pilipes]